MWGYERLDQVVGVRASTHCANAEIPAQSTRHLREQDEWTEVSEAKRKDGGAFYVTLNVAPRAD